MEALLNDGRDDLYGAKEVVSCFFFFSVWQM